MYDVIYFLCIQTIVFNFEIKLNKKLKYKLIIIHMFKICNFYFCVNQIYFSIYQVMIDN
jgi:hypothetical protein